MRSQARRKFECDCCGMSDVDLETHICPMTEAEHNASLVYDLESCKHAEPKLVGSHWWCSQCGELWSTEERLVPTSRTTAQQIKAMMPEFVERERATRAVRLRRGLRV